MEGTLLPRLVRRLVVILLLGGTALLVYNKRVGIADPDGIDVVQLLLRPDVWFGLAVIMALVVMPWHCLRLAGGQKSAQKILQAGPVVAYGSAVLGSMLAWARFGVGMNAFGAQVCVRIVLCTLLGILIYNLAQNSRGIRGGVLALLRWTPLAGVILGFCVLLSPAFVGAVFGPGMLVEGSGLFSFGARYQGLTSNPDMVATSSCVAIALLLPGFLRDLSKARPFAVIKGIYLVGLAGVIAWSGVRAMAFILLLVAMAALGLSFRFTKRGLVRFAYIICAMAVIVLLGGLGLGHSGVMNVIVDRFHSTDGRLFLWKFYWHTLLLNPFGLGFGFESIVHTDQIIPGQRLPPHNTLLEMAMYGGWIGLLVHLLVLGWMVRAIIRAKMAFGHGSPLPVRLQSLVLGWMAGVASLFFAGLIFIDYYYTIMTALLLVELGCAGCRQPPSKAAAGSEIQVAEPAGI
jgi:hypothetical protein